MHHLNCTLWSILCAFGSCHVAVSAKGLALQFQINPAHRCTLRPWTAQFGCKAFLQLCLTTRTYRTYLMMTMPFMITISSRGASRPHSSSEHLAVDLPGFHTPPASPAQRAGRSIWTNLLLLHPGRWDHRLGAAV